LYADIMNSIFSTAAAVSLILTMILDNTIAGSREERGLQMWQALEGHTEWWTDPHMNKVSALFTFPKGSALFTFSKGSALFTFPKGSALITFPKGSAQFTLMPHLPRLLAFRLLRFCCQMPLLHHFRKFLSGKRGDCNVQFRELGCF
jgi:hypothetical protein